MPGSDDVNIGDFSRPVVPKPKGPPPVGTTSASGLAASGATHDALVAAESQLDEEASKDEAALRPMLTYEDKLAAAKLTREQAAQIVDAVLVRGFWAEDVPVTKTVRARFRTRSARDVRRANEMLEAQRWTIDAHYHDAMSRIMLAASLEKFGDVALKHVPNPRKATEAEVEKAFAERLAYVESLAEPAMRMLFAKLWKFDNRVSVALEEGTVENF
jgi:hypothetical protein